MKNSLDKDKLRTAIFCQFDLIIILKTFFLIFLKFNGYYLFVNINNIKSKENTVLFKHL